MSYQTYSHNRNHGCRITEFIYRGYRCLSLENEKLRVTVVVDKGADIIEFLYKPLDVDFLWRTRTGLPEAGRFIPSSPRAAGPHNDLYPGGWQELFPNCGPASIHRNAEIGQHGEVSLLPWNHTILTDRVDLVEVRLHVRTVRTPFLIERVLRLEGVQSRLGISERVTNEGGQPVEFTWGHHPALGWPFLDENCRVDLPPCLIRTFSDFHPASTRLAPDQTREWPYALSENGDLVDLSVMGPPSLETEDMVFLEGLADGWYAVTSPTRRVGFGLVFPRSAFKWLWYWRVFRGGRDYPWWSSTYCAALEPCTSLPVLRKAVERGDALALGPGESLDVRLLAVAYQGLERVREIGINGEVR